MLKRFTSPRSIGTRLTVLTLAMVVILFGGLGVFIAWQNAKALRESLASKSSSVADLASRTGAEYMATYNFMALDHLVDDIAKDPDVAFAAFYNDKKVLLTKRLPEGKGDLQVVERQLKDEGSGVTLGTLQIGYRQDSVVKSLFRSISIVVAGTLAAILLFSIGIAFASRRLIVKPIQRLCEFSAHVSKGDLSQKLEQTCHDEIGALTYSLNAMVSNLNQMVQQVDSAARELHFITENISGASGKVRHTAKLQAEGVNTASAAVTEINYSVNEVSKGVGTLSLSADETSSSIIEIAASITEVAGNVESFAGSVEDVSSSIVQMSLMVKQIGNSIASLQGAAATTSSSLMQMDDSVKQVEKSAVDAAAISEEVRRDAVSGKEAVDATITGISEIKNSWDITFDVIDTLSVKARDISAILSVIDEVAEQTNLLALNAAIIAAQSGEYGKGFAVVADEIKQLADRTSSYTREILDVINGVQNETRRAVDAIRQAEQRIDEAERLSHRSGDALAKIVSGAWQVTTQVEGIASATTDQSRGSNMIRTAMEQVSDMVAEIAHASQEQIKESDAIMAAVGRMEGLTVEVRRSAREQSKAGSFISNSTQRIMDMILQIKRACDEQMRGSDQILHAVEDIQLSTTTNLEATEVMGEAVSRLSTQAQLLKKEMNRFKV